MFEPIFQHEYFYDKTVTDEFISVNICLTITIDYWINIWSAHVFLLFWAIE